jgi:hypothetical protein
VAGFEQNQQDAFNQRNAIESIKQSTADLDKFAASLGEAELTAEKELATLKLSNLEALQKEKLKKLDKLLEQEKAGLRELESIRLTTSDKQFEARKKQIQDELKLSKDAVEELRKIASKKFEAPINSPNTAPKTNSGTQAKTASADNTTNATNAKLLGLVGSIDNTLSSLRDTIVTFTQKGKDLLAGADKQPAQSSATKDLQAAATAGTSTVTEASTANNAAEFGKMQTGSPNTAEVEAGEQKERQYSDAGLSYEDKFGLGSYSFEAISTSFDTLKDSLETGALKALNSVTARNGKYTAQSSIDLAGGLLGAVKETEATKQKIQDFNANLELNAKLAFLKKEQDTKLKYLGEYQGYLEQAGKYAVSQEEYEADRARKDRDAAKKEASNVSKLFEDLKSGKFNATDYKKSTSKYINKRTQELNKFSGFDKNAKANYIKELKASNPGMTSKEAKAQLDAEMKRAEASAKLTANFELLAEAAGGLAATLDAKVKEISSMQGIVDTRLQGSRTNERDFGNGSYWNQLLEDAKKIAGASPFIKQEKLVDNIKALVDKGISFDIKQRAFLMTIQEKIANTFNVADGTLLRLIRIQQQDTTAGRLGMESALNSFLNSMYETSEYLENVAANVRSSLEEMQALMEGAAGTELEFQVQKWMGSLYSVGMSDNVVQDIAKTFGQIASGDVSGLTGSGTGNLLIMAANEAGMSIADILQEGLNADETNKLMQAMVNYLAEIAETSSDSKVVQQQLANVYGMKASDLRAATNLATSLKDVSKQDLTYSGMLGQLESMMNTIRFRTSIGEGLTNMWDNMMYSMASTQASNPILYALPKMADLLRDVTGGGGIALPFVNVMGFGVDLNTSVADLMSVASMAGTALGSLGPLLTGIGDLVNPFVGSSMLSRAGIKTSGKVPVLARGSARPLQHLGGSSISESGYVGNSSGEDVKNATLQDAEDSKKKQMVEAKDEESADDVVTKANLAVVNIYNLLEEVAHGSQSLRVRVINNNSGTSASGSGAGGTNSTIGDTSNVGSTGAMGGSSLVNGATGGADNGNWVLSF